MNLFLSAGRRLSVVAFSEGESRNRRQCDEARLGRMMTGDGNTERESVRERERERRLLEKKEDCLAFHSAVFRGFDI